MAGDASAGMPLMGESDGSDVGLGDGSLGRGNPDELHGPTEGRAGAAIGPAAGLAGGGLTDMDDGTTGPAQSPDVEGGAESGTTAGVDLDTHVDSAAGVGTEPGLAGLSEGLQTAGSGGNPDRGTVAGVGTVGEGMAQGGGTGGLSGTNATHHRSTQPVEDSGSVT